MKIAILAAGGSNYFPLFIDKPKCLYHKDGKIQLEKVIETVKQVVKEEDIIIVGGYKYKHIERFLTKYPKITFKINHNYAGPAIYTLRKAIENIEEDVVFLLADESISLKNVKRVAESVRDMSILCHNEYYYYSLGIFKLNKTQIQIINDDCYLDFEYIKKIYCFANNKQKYDGKFNINSGICMGYITIDFIRRIGNISKIENPIKYYTGANIDFLHYNPSEEYIDDLDKFKDTDEYKNSLILRLYSDCVSDVIRKIIKEFNKLKNLAYK